MGIMLKEGIEISLEEMLLAMYIHSSVEYKIRDDLMNFEIECLTMQVKK